MTHWQGINVKTTKNQTLGRNKGRSLKNKGKQRKIPDDSLNGRNKFGHGSQIVLKSVWNQRTAKRESEQSPAK